MQTLRVIAITVFALGGFVCWGISVYNMFRVVALRKPGVSAWHGTGLNPFNLLLQPAKLTPAGPAARRRHFQGFIGFIICWLLGAAAGVVLGFND